MTTYQSLTMDALCDRLAVRRNTLIVFHARPDADGIGSAFALRDLLAAMGIPAVCACADEVPDRLRFLSESAQGSVLLDEEMGLDHERVISVDTASPEQMGALYERLRRDIDLMIDHHRSGFGIWKAPICTRRTCPCWTKTEMSLTAWSFPLVPAPFDLPLKTDSSSTAVSRSSAVSVTITTLAHSARR